MKAAAVDRLVVDASIAVAWCFDDEKTPLTERILDRMAAGTEAVVPAIWPFEVANALLVAERRRRLTAAQSTLFLDQLGSFNVSMEPSAIPRVFDRILMEARSRHLTAYDAAYLELALRRGLPLATLDEGLRRAARTVGVPLVQGAGTRHLG